MQMRRLFEKGSDIATPTNSSALSSWHASTKKRFDAYMSRKAAHNGFSDQTMTMLPSAIVISESLKPSDLNIVDAVPLIALNGMPIAR